MPTDIKNYTIHNNYLSHQIFRAPNSQQYMGEVATKICGGSGPLDLLLKKYGDDIGRFIAIEKVKQFLDGKMGSLKDTVGNQSGAVLQKVIGTIDDKKTQLNNQFQNYKQTINTSYPGGIETIQKLKGEPIENILGVNQFFNKFDQLKTTATTKFQQQQKTVFNTIDQTGQQQKQLLDSQKPKVPLYDDLSESQQKLVFKQGEKMFAKQIQQQQDTIVKSLGDKLNPQTYLGNFKNLVPTSSLDGIVTGATSKFQTVKTSLLALSNPLKMFSGFGN